MEPFTFEEFLKEEHAKHYYGTDDNMPDAFDHWLSCLDSNDVMELAEEALRKAQMPIIKA